MMNFNLQIEMKSMRFESNLALELHKNLLYGGIFLRGEGDVNLLIAMGVGFLIQVGRGLFNCGEYC